MKNVLFIFKACLFIILLSACTEEDTLESSTEKFVSDIKLTKQNAFTDEEIALTFNAKNYDSISVTSDEASIILTPISVTSFTITSDQQSSGGIDIFTRKITTSNDTIDQVDRVLVNFHEHGTTNYLTFEGLSVTGSNIYDLLLIQGKPEGITTENVEITVTDPDTEETTTSISVYENWHYLAKGLTYRSFRHSGIITSVTVYGNEWTATLDDETTATGVKYPYEIADLGNFTDGILMDTIIEKLGVQNNTVDEIDLKAYIYNGKGTYYFTTDDIDVYTGKSVDYITF